MKNKCYKCDKLATWRYMPVDCDVSMYQRYLCENCVNRGCSCNIIDAGDINVEEYKDELGRLLPCCEYDFSEYGYDLNDFESEKYND